MALQSTKGLQCVLILLHLCRMTTSMQTKKNPKNIFNAEKDKTLTSHVIVTHHVTSSIDCSFLCMSNIKCKSHDYHPDSAACKLNNATKHSNVLQYINSPGNMHYEPQAPRSCLDLLCLGASQNGIYTITDNSGDSYQVFCDLTSEPRSAWTLILSMAFKHRAKNEFRTIPFIQNAPLNENNPNWELYRQTLARMKQLSSRSTHVRATTGFAEYGIDFTDYFRAKISDLNILALVGSPSCKTVEYINIRGNIGIGATVSFFQRDSIILHVDTSATHGCDFDATSGAVYDEDDFMVYYGVNKNFRGSANQESTSQFWFGGYM